MSTNKRVLFAKRPLGEPDDDCFKIDEVEIPALGPNEILIKTCWLSLDPYMRGRMNDMKSYTEPMQIGDVMTGESTGIVEQSNSDKWQVGDRVAAHMGWQTYIVAKGDDARLMKVDLDNGSLSAHLGVVGMPGRTAYFGLTEVGKPKAGETLVVAAASGAVGSAVGQIAKILGLRAIGIAGGSEKCRYVKEELQFDDCLDYKSGNLDDKLSVACPDGIDLYFENVGGDVTKAVALQLNQGARVPICGYISNYNDEDITKAETPFHILKQLEHVPEHRFFVVYEWQDRYDEATRQLGEWIKEGHLKYRESVGEGLENAPELFRGLLRGKNFGKQLVKIAEEEI
ncbi:MAG: NADP-dependent oxidoreductase [Pseudomonadota bacterium]|nr:NADP-dependent oxidoreductase [Pseudomonadota bacterium]MEE3237318.1 NADP-dependent oxidoreductase [Pseudomonadota bacterium]